MFIRKIMFALSIAASAVITTGTGHASEYRPPVQTAVWMAPGKAMQTAPAPYAGRRWRETIAPFAHVRFCIEHADQCQRRRVSIRKRGVAMTPARLAELTQVNRQVNAAIRPSAAHEGPTGDTWTLAPTAGDCDDYAVTKRARLLAQGWPSSALLLTHVLTRDGQNHLVLIARLIGGDVILDNLASAPRLQPLERTFIVKIQSPVDPNLWLKPINDLRISDAGASARPS